MRKQKIKRFVFFILILCTFSLFLYYYFIPLPDNLYKEDKKIQNDQNKLLLNQKKIHCPSCNFTPVYPPSSTRRDVVLAAALNKLKRVETFLRTLRMTGSRCRVILFLDNQQTIEPHFLRFFKSCDIEPVYIDNNNNSVLIGGAKMTRYYYYQQWLSMHIDEVDRVLHSDTFDVLFQADPFRDDMLPMPKYQEESKHKPILLSTNNKGKNKRSKITSEIQTNPYSNSQINTNISQKRILNNEIEDEKLNNNDLQNVLYFTFEPVSLGDSRWTASWVSQCYGPNILHKYRKNPVSCSGVTIGYSKAFLKYLDVMLSKNSWRRCFGDSLDQAHHNYVLYHGDLNNAGIKIKSLDCNSKFLTMHFCCKKGKCHLDEKTNIMYGNATNQAPVLVHQYNRWKNLTKRNKLFCPGSAKDLFAVKNNSTDNNKMFDNSLDMAQIEKLPPLKVNLPDNLVQFN